MKIETYEIEEVAGELDNMAADSEALKLCRKMGLESQLTMSDKTTDTRFPYPKMTTQEALIYGILCPVKTPIEKYDASIIPLRVLQVAAFCREHPIVKRLEIWHPAVVRNDPVLVAWDSTYAGNCFILARWGNVLEPLEKLIELARPLLLATKRSKFAEIKAEVAAAEAMLEQRCEQALLTGENFEPHVWGLK